MLYHHSGTGEAGVAQPQLLQAGKTGQQDGNCRPAETVPVQNQLRESMVREVREKGFPYMEAAYSYAIKNQGKARNAPSMGVWVP